MKALRFLLIIVCTLSLTGCASTKQADSDSSLGKAQQTLDSFINITQQRTLICFGKAIPLTNNTKSLIWHRKTKQTRLISSPIYGHIRVLSLQ